MAIDPSVSCNWSSAADIVTNIKANKLNVTSLVKQCEGICQTAFESKFPVGEITGEGVMVSIYTQVALVCLFGALLPGIIWLISLISWPPSLKLLPLLRKFQTHIYKTNTLFSLTLMVATLVRYHQNPSAIEVVFLSRITTGQIEVLAALYFAQLVDRDCNDKTLDMPYSLIPVTVGLAQVATNFLIQIPNVGEYHDLAKQCHDQHQFISISSYFKESLSRSSTVKVFFAGFAGGIVLIALLVIAFSVFSFKARFISKAWWRHVSNILDNVAVVAYVMSAVLSTFRAELVRKDLKKLNVGQVKDKGWGYGEMTAILIWVLFLAAVIKESFIEWKLRTTGKTVITEEKIHQPDIREFFHKGSQVNFQD